MARALSDILTELNSVYDPQRSLYNQQIAGLDPQMEAENKGLEAQKQDSFGQITAGANRRGLLFSGIPLAEQASYVGQSFLPAVANLKAKYAQQRFNLQDAIAKITQEQYSKGQDIYQTELNRDLAEQEAARARASGGGGSGGGFGGFAADGGGGGGGTAPGARAKPSIAQRPGGGFNFTDAQGRGISAARYSQLTGIPFRSLLQQMANAGDGGARTALGLVGNDYGYNRGKVGNNGSYVSLLRALGVNASPTRSAGASGGAGRGW